MRRSNLLLSTRAAISITIVFKKPMNLLLIEKPHCFLFNSVFSDGWHFMSAVFFHVSTEFITLVQGETALCSRVSLINRNNHKGFLDIPPVLS